MKRTFALLIAAALVLTLIPAVALGDTATFQCFDGTNIVDCTATTIDAAVTEAVGKAGKTLIINGSVDVPGTLDLSVLNMVIFNGSMNLTDEVVTIGSSTAIVAPGGITVSGTGEIVSLVAPAGAVYTYGTGASVTIATILTGSYSLATAEGITALLTALATNNPAGTLCTAVTINSGTVTLGLDTHALMYKDTLNVASGAKLIVPTGATLEAYGTVNGGGGISVSGTIENNGTLQTKSDGSISVGSGGKITNNGEITAVAGTAGSAAASTTANGVITNAGTITGGTVTVPVDATLNNNGTVTGNISNFGTTNNYGTIVRIANMGELNTYRGTIEELNEDGGTVNYIDPITYYQIDIIAGEGGSAYPYSPTFAAENGDSARIIFTADKGYTLAYVMVDGVNMGNISEYTFKTVRANHKIEAVFVAGSTLPPQTGAASLIGFAVLSILGAAGCFIAGKKNDR